MGVGVVYGGVRLKNEQERSTSEVYNKPRFLISSALAFDADWL
jgi:hypothetical protein